jgi:hypothetical protein
MCSVNIRQFYIRKVSVWQDLGFYLVNYLNRNFDKIETLRKVFFLDITQNRMSLKNTWSPIHMSLVDLPNIIPIMHVA